MFDRPDVEIVMLHVIEEDARSMRGMEIARAMAQMEFLARQEFEFARTSRRVERGRPVDSILAYAANAPVDAIVIPAGSGSLGHAAEEVLTGARGAVWLDRVMDSAGPVPHICCAVGLDGTDEAVLRRAVEVAAEFGAELTILHAVVPESPMLLWWDADAFEQELRIARLRADELREKFAPVAHLHVASGRPDRVLSQALQRLNADLLVVAEHEDAIAAAVCPVLRIAARHRELSREVRMETGNTFVVAAGAA